MNDGRVAEAHLYEVSNSHHFTDKSIRMGFIRKVYGILFLQILLTAGVIATFLFVPEVSLYLFLYDIWIFYSSLAGIVVCLITLNCGCVSLRRKFPANAVLLIIFTILEGTCLAAVSGLYDTDTIILASGSTLMITFGLFLFTLQTKWDLTVVNGILLVVLMAPLGIALIIHQWELNYKIVTLAYSALVATLFSSYIVVETHFMLEGRYDYSLSPEEYTFAALNLYLDIFNMFRLMMGKIKNL